MKKHYIWAALGVAFLMAAAFLPAGVLEAMALPLTALSALLRMLSLSGGVGNVLAIGIFALVCLSPLAVFLKSKRRGEDWLLVLLVPVAAFALYLTVNPGLRPPMMQSPGEEINVGDMTYAGAIWSVVITWLVLKLVRSGERILSVNIFKALRIFLLVWCAQSLIVGLSSAARECWWQISYFRGLQYADFFRPLPNYLCAGLNFAVSAVERGLTALVLWKAAKLLEAMERDPYSAETVAASGDVSQWCRQMLVIISLSALALNLARIMLAAFLMNVSTTVHIPVQSLALAFGMLALTRLLVQGKALKDESDLFI